MENILKTPFGNLYVKVNGILVNYNYEIIKKSYDNIMINVYSINYDVLNLKIGDVITFEIDNCQLSYGDGDERCETLIVENDDLILGMTGYEPQYHEGERLQHCYELVEYFNSKFEYKIERKPDNYKNSYTLSHSIQINISWINKNSFSDFETAINLITWL